MQKVALPMLYFLCVCLSTHWGVTATIPAAIYSVPDMIGEELRDALVSALVEPMERELMDADGLERFLNGEAVAPHMKAWLAEVLRDLLTVKASQRRPRTLATSFVLLSALYLEEIFPKGRSRGSGGGFFGARLMGGDWKVRIAPKMSRMFADKSAQSQKYTLGDRLRARLMNYAAVAMFACMPTGQVDLRHFCDVFGVVDKHGRQVLAVVGARCPRAKKGEEEKARELWALQAPLKLPKVRMNKRK